jgi:hypothetical protein
MSCPHRITPEESEQNINVVEDVLLLDNSGHIVAK